MNISPVTTIAASTAALIWAVKAVAIGAFGRDSYDDPVTSALFVLGLVAFVVGAVSLAWTALRGRHLVLRVLGATGAVVLGAGFAAATTPVFESLVDSWVGAELNLWILAGVLLAVVARGSAGGATRAHDTEVASGT